MKKTGTPWFRKGTNAWYVWHSGQQIKLATGWENKAEAYARFAELLANPQPPTQRPTVGVLVDAFEKSAGERLKPGTLDSYRCVLRPFVTKFGDEPADVLTPDAVVKWASGQRWGQTTRRYALTVLGTVLNWAVDAKHIPATDGPGRVCFASVLNLSFVAPGIPAIRWGLQG